MTRRLPGADLALMTAAVSSTSDLPRYGTTPSQTQLVGVVACCPAASSAASSRSCVKSTATYRSVLDSGDRSPSRTRLSCCDAAWSTSNTSTSASSPIRQARPSRPAPRITSCGECRSRTASSMAIVRGTMISAQARTISNGTRSPHPFGAVPARTCATGTRSSSRSSAIEVGSANRPGAARSCAAARPWQTSTAVWLGARASMRAFRVSGFGFALAWVRRLLGFGLLVGRSRRLLGALAESLGDVLGLVLERLACALCLLHERLGQRLGLLAELFGLRLGLLRQLLGLALEAVECTHPVTPVSVIDVPRAHASACASRRHGCWR